MNKIAIILAGCGAADGSEIHESVHLMTALSKAGVEYKIFAPNIEQREVINMATGQSMEQSRNVLVESARIARGEIEELSKLSCDDFDALAFPGGFGAAKNLFTFAYDGTEFTVREDIKDIVESFHAAKKPIAAMCIAPVMIAKVLGKHGVEVTLGPTTTLCSEVEQKFGAKVTETSKCGAITDSANKVVTTPAYMYGDNTIANIAAGAEALVSSLIKL